MTTSTKPDVVRERILKAACDLFRHEGIHATGVDRISEAAGVSKRSLYQRFSSKDELVAAYLAMTGPQIMNGYLPTECDDSDPRARLLAVFTALQAQSAADDFRGCPFLNAAAELPDPKHPGRALAVQYKLDMQAFFARQAALANADDPESLAQQLMMLFDGGLSYALIHSTMAPDGILTAARALINASASSPAA